MFIPFLMLTSLREKVVRYGTTRAMSILTSMAAMQLSALAIAIPYYVEKVSEQLNKIGFHNL